MCSKDVWVKKICTYDCSIIIAWRLQIYANESASEDNNNIILHPILYVCVYGSRIKVNLWIFLTCERMEILRSGEHIYSHKKSCSEAHADDRAKEKKNPKQKMWT